MTIFRNRHLVGGFTLLEVLVALFIAAISVGAIGMTLGHMRSSSQFQQQAERFSIWLERTRQHAVVRNMTYRIDYDTEKNVFSLLEYRKDEWQRAFLDKTNMSNPEGMMVRHADDKNEAPLQILIFPDNSYSEFNFYFVASSKKQISVSGDGFNTLIIDNKDS